MIYKNVIYAKFETTPGLNIMIWLKCSGLVFGLI